MGSRPNQIYSLMGFTTTISAIHTQIPSDNEPNTTSWKKPNIWESSSEIIEAGI